MAKKYESGSAGPSTIARNSGDPGGASYGTFQIATKTGTMNSFLKYLQNASPGMYKTLAGKTPGTAAFDQAWKAIANANPAGFDKIQETFIKQSHYDPAVANIKKSTGFDANSYSNAIQQVVWSTATQHGAAGAARVFKNAGIKQGMSEREIIQRIYAERSKTSLYFPSASAKIKQSVANRFKNEMADALRMLG